jgi:signal transduction histidine kinase
MIRLHRLTAHLSRSVGEAEMATIVVEEGTAALAAHGAAIWRLDGERRHLELVASHRYAGIEDSTHVPIETERPICQVARTGESVWLEARAVLPLAIEGNVVGVLAVRFDGEHPFVDNERAFVELLAWHCAQSMERARLYAVERAARREQELLHERASFLARTSGLLGSSLDYEDTLRNVARMAVPRLADWCSVELGDGEHGSRQLAVAHVDPAKVALAEDMRRRFPPDPAAATGAASVMRSGQSRLFVEITDAMLVAGARSEEHLRLARELGLRSAIIVPIRDRDAVLGAITLVFAEGGRQYTQEDVVMGEQLGERAGAAIANARLYDEARRAVTLRDEFLSIAGHELRTPLAAISLHLQSMLRSPDEMSMVRVRERITKLVGQSERLAALIEDLLDVTKLMSGRVELEPRDLDLGALVKQCVERMRDEFDRAGTPLQLRLAAVRGRWDRSRLDQVTTNLLSNALKYGRGQPVSVDVALDDDFASLAVTDRGIGVAPEDHTRIFERFERAVSPRNFGGFGLGLWIVRKLVEAHGGTISVTSALGAGATFTVTLPMASPPSSR